MCVYVCVCCVVSQSKTFHLFFIDLFHCVGKYFILCVRFALYNPKRKIDSSQTKIKLDDYVVGTFFFLIFLLSLSNLIFYFNYILHIHATVLYLISLFYWNRLEIMTWKQNINCIVLFIILITVILDQSNHLKNPIKNSFKVFN